MSRYRMATVSRQFSAHWINPQSMNPRALTMMHNESDTARVDQSALAVAVDLLSRSQHIAAAAHIMPDPDAIGSLLGFGLAMRGIGRQVTLLCDDSVPHSVRFLPGADTIKSSMPANSPIDLFVSLDASDVERLGKVAEPFFAANIPVLVIDHHITNIGFGTVNLVNSEWSATAEGVVDLLHEMQIPLTLEIATCLLAGLVGDTRSFATANTTPASMIAAAELMRAGADIRYVSEMLYNRRTLDSLRIWGIGLSHIEVEKGVFWSVIPLDERQKQGIRETNGSGLSNLLVSVEDAKIGAIFTEQADGIVDASFRARPGYDVAAVALALGGGGHAAAAGAKLQGPLLETARRVVALLVVAASVEAVADSGTP
jgi:phosphoesterase RecJ-like protein